MLYSAAIIKFTFCIFIVISFISHWHVFLFHTVPHFFTESRKKCSRDQFSLILFFFDDNNDHHHDHDVDFDDASVVRRNEW